MKILVINAGSSSIKYQLIDMENETLLAKGQNFLFTHPHMILFPAIFISLLMLCFNLFGNGLRDAFNPSLRGTDE